jgi:hypothetical protein
MRVAYCVLKKRPNLGKRAEGDQSAPPVRFDERCPLGSIPAMADQIIDITHYLDRDTEDENLPGAIALWGVDGERHRFALPLWRVVHLSGADRGVILWRSTSGDRTPHPFVVIDVARDPARLGLNGPWIARCESHESAMLHDLGRDGIVVYLGTRGERIWCLLAEGGRREGPLDPKRREDILFMAGECAGLLFLRDFTDAVEDQDPSDE